MKNGQRMGAQITRWAGILSLIFVSLNSPAQTTQSSIPENGFWQLITSPDLRNTTIVQFYTFRSQLVYEEKLEGVKLNMRRHQTYVRLNQILEKALQAWEEKKSALKDMGWVAWAMKS